MPITSRTRARLRDGAAADALTLYVDGAALVARRGCSALLHPLGYVARRALRLAARGLPGAGPAQKYAGLRILR